MLWLEFAQASVPLLSVSNRPTCSGRSSRGENAPPAVSPLGWGCKSANLDTNSRGSMPATSNCSNACSTRPGSRSCSPASTKNREMASCREVEANSNHVRRLRSDAPPPSSLPAVETLVVLKRLSSSSPPKPSSSMGPGPLGASPSADPPLPLTTWLASCTALARSKSGSCV